MGEINFLGLMFLGSTIGWLLAEFKGRRPLRITCGLAAVVSAWFLMFALESLRVDYTQRDARACFLMIEKALNADRGNEVRSTLARYREHTGRHESEALFDLRRELEKIVESSTAPPVSEARSVDASWEGRL